MSEQPKNIMLLHPMAKGVEKYAGFFAEAKDVEVVGLSGGPDTPRSRRDHALSGAETVIKVQQAEANGFQAVVFTCHGDPELYPLRDAVRIPVLGPMEIGMHFAAMLAHRFSIFTPEPWVKREQEDNAIKYGLESKVASIRIMPFTQPLEEVGRLALLRPIPKEIIAPVVEEGIKAVEEDDATAIVFGCGCLMGMGDELQKRLKDRGVDVLVINPVPLAVDVARVLIKLKISHSKLAYPFAS